MHCFTWTILAGLLALSSAVGLPQRPSGGYQEQDTARAFYSYGYSDDNAARAEYSSRDGTSRGFYSYVDAEGKLQTVRYEANGVQGFKAEASNQPQAPVDEGKAPLPVSDTEEVQQARLSHLNALREAREKALAASLREEADRRQQQEQNRNNGEDQQSEEQSLSDEDAAILDRVRAELSAMLADRQRSSSLPRNREEEELRRDQNIRQELRQDLRQELRQDQREDRRPDQREDRRQDQREERRQDQREDRRQDQREERRQDERDERLQDQREERRQDQRDDRRPEQREDQESRQAQRQNERQDQSRNQDTLRELNNNRENDRQSSKLLQLQTSSDRDANDSRLRTIYSLADLSSRSYLKLGDLASTEKLLEDRLDNSDLRVPISAYYTLVSPNTKYSVTTPTELRTLRPVALSRSLLVSKRN
ncbi:vicilin-like seed storage protein At2g18540 [Drosophila subpulchrella]|uniref:vicilin-like seed storage protein At2g18540 n=1 Tax=Drosophila subpulchrella TaxID=1486046 RepID=UPI0018A15B1F|nr:vicilin-like seed storage protein At2g18540 [Drosophila subpulchrella]